MWNRGCSTDRFVGSLPTLFPAKANLKVSSHHPCHLNRIPSLPPEVPIRSIPLLRRSKVIVLRGLGLNFNHNGQSSIFLLIVFRRTEKLEAHRSGGHFTLYNNLQLKEQKVYQNLDPKPTYVIEQILGAYLDCFGCRHGRGHKLRLLRPLSEALTSFHYFG